ncbi:hypothetical protein HX021_09120 [Sphingobacterium sp. N143]|uniref:hypothetical protein n=1 Tax=Sphingobacterium sp. N143 TaxID=2746727 RepID=UPI0025784D1E|nr:hypothetical protein [Sphingobacterium sp. N143]MDM1294451.1 hypothetical protein [Sphingobacterium sp. N143]
MQKLLKLSSIFSIVILSLSMLTVTSCAKFALDNEGLIDPSLKNLTLHTGFTDNIIPIHADIWTVSYVREATTGEILRDSTGKALKLENIGAVQLDKGWLKMEKTNKNELKLTLLENFNSRPRNFVIGILSADKKEEISFTQNRGEGYELLKKEVEEVKGSRKITVSAEGCGSMELRNNSNREKKVDITSIFKDVKSSSLFASSDYGAFDWVNQQDSLVSMDELLVDGVVHWRGRVPYIADRTFEEYIKPGSKEELLLKPHTTIRVRGQVKYLERTCRYTFTIKNKTSGNRFEVQGIWKQKIPLSTCTVLE